jgi:peptide chain release factor 1
VGQAQDDRSQYKNRQLAFRRMAESKKFQDWVKIEVARINGEVLEIEKKIDRDLLDPNKIKVEVWKGGRWVEESGLI